MVVFSETAADDALNDEVPKMASSDDPIYSLDQIC